MLDKIFNRKNILLLSFILFFIILAYSLIAEDSTTIAFSSPDTLNEGWKYDNDATNFTNEISRIITSDIVGKSISFQTLDSYITVYVGDELVYSFGSDYLKFGKSPGSYFHLVTIPTDSLNKELAIKINTIFKKQYKETYSFYVGYNNEVLHQMIKDDMFKIFTNGIILLFGLVILLVNVLDYRNNKHIDASNVYLAIISIAFSVWASSLNFSTQLLLHNSIFLYYLNYVSIFTIVLAFILHIEALVPLLSLKREFLVEVISVLVVTASHFMGIFSYTETIEVFSLVTAICIVSSFIKLKANFRYINDILGRISLYVITICVVLHVICFVCKLPLYYYDRIYFIKVGIIFYLLITIRNGFINLLEKWQAYKEAEALKTIAYKDILTDTFNRFSFEKDIKELSLEDICIVSFDLNNLKYYNDNFGHDIGDTLIKDASIVLCKVYEKIYRTGGDEFQAIVSTKDDNELESLKEKLHTLTKEYNNDESSKVILEIASGYSYYKKGDKSYVDILKRADKKMYVDKHNLKANSKLQKKN